MVLLKNKGLKVINILVTLDHGYIGPLCVMLRSLCESIALKLGTIGYVPILLRTRSGPFVSEHALTIPELRQKARLTLVSAATIAESGAHDVLQKDSRYFRTFE